MAKIICNKCGNHCVGVNYCRDTGEMLEPNLKGYIHLLPTQLKVLFNKIASVNTLLFLVRVTCVLLICYITYTTLM